jgi:hypothetical protein
MEIWYQVQKHIYGNQKFINQVEVEKSTDKSVCVRSEYRNQLERHAISSDYDSYFRTFEEAKQFALKRQSDKIESATNEMCRLQSDYAKIYDQVE